VIAYTALMTDEYPLFRLDLDETRAEPAGSSPAAQGRRMPMAPAASGSR
jgi:hypothetical protein